MSHRAVICLNPEEEQILRQWARAGTSEHRMVERAKIILLAHQGKSNLEIAAHLKTRPARVSKWRRRFSERRLDGLRDADRVGRPAHYDKATEKRVLTMLDEPPPEGYGKWSGGLLAEALGDISNDQVWRVLRKHDICLQRRRSWCISTDPQFGPKAADIVGLYLNPPENALVLCVDEKPSIQALERAQGWLRLPNGKALNGRSHGYKRHGTTTLFAAFDIATGQVVAGHYHRRRRREFFGFHEADRGRLPRPRSACRAGQLEYAQTERRPLAQAPSESPFAFHSDVLVMVEPSGMLVQHTEQAGPPGSEFHFARTTAGGH
jgi:transposase